MMKRYISRILAHSILWSIALYISAPYAMGNLMTLSTWHPYIGGGGGMQSSFSPSFCVASLCQGDRAPISAQYSGFIGIEKDVSKLMNIGIEYQYAISNEGARDNIYRYNHNNVIITAEYHVKKIIGIGIHMGLAINNLSIETEGGQLWKSNNTTGGLFGAKIEYYPINNLGIALRYSYYLGYQTSFIMPETGFIGNVNVGGISAMLLTLRLIL